MAGKGWNLMEQIRLVATDIDGTFVHADHHYDQVRFHRIFEKMQQANCHFVVASGDQYYTLRDLFADVADQITFVAENGALIVDHGEILLAQSMDKEAVTKIIELTHRNPEIQMTMCGLKGAYCERGAVDQAFFDLTHKYYHQLSWVDNFANVDDQILKFAANVPSERTTEYIQLFQQELYKHAEPTSSGYGAIDLIIPGCHKAAGLKTLTDRWQISSTECMAFGDGGNDIEMLQFCKHSYAMANASAEVKKAAANHCPSNEEGGVLDVLEEMW